MRVAILKAIVPVLLLAALPATSLAADARAGQDKARINVCMECHEPDGNSTMPEYPRLAGQQADYLHKQLREFQSGTRKSQIMNALSQGIADADFADIAAWFASQTRVAGEARASAAGRELFERGSASVPACAACHGADGQGRQSDGIIYPAIAGQHRFYLRGQLFDWRSGTRRNSPGDIMNQVTKGLGDEQIEALADYLSGLKAP